MDYFKRHLKLNALCAGIVAAGLSGCASAPAELNDQQGSAFEALVGGNAAKSALSPAAALTRPASAPEYDSPRFMLENADMAAFMEESRRLHESGEGADGWGFAALDMLAADDATGMLNVVTDMPEDTSSGVVLTSNWLKPWASAAAGDLEDAKEAMSALADILPPHLATGHQALFLEGIGDHEGALAVYAEELDEFDRPDEDEEPSSETLARSLAFGFDRILAIRQARLLHKMEREQDALAVYGKLMAADENDIYVQSRIDELNAGEALDEPPLDLKSALALALNDEANVLEERQALASVFYAQGAEAPFNYYLSALRQAALVLAPANASIRAIEAEHLYNYGFFEPAARLALAGEASDEERAELMLTAASSYLELRQIKEVRKLVKTALAMHSDESSLLQAADLLTRADDGEGAERMANRALRIGDLQPEMIAYAQVLRAEALLQSGRVPAAIEAARKAYSANDDDALQGFLASMLTESALTREEGLAIYRELFLASPDDPGMMNNFGYSLIKDPMTSQELDEGYRLLKKANRITPFEPNLLDSLGWAYYQYGDFDRALEYIERALAAYEPFAHWELLDHHGDVLWRLGDVSGATKSWEKSLNARPPRHRRDDISAKVREGMTTPPPEKRAPPVVPTDQPLETNEI